MKYLLERLSDEMNKAFERAGYDGSYGTVVVSNRPDLCEFQCNGAMAAAKKEKKNPFDIAEAVIGELSGSECFSKAEAVRPGFLNLTVKDEFLTGVLTEMYEAPKCGTDEGVEKQDIILDYGGPNVAKPLHIGHLRSAIIGEALKRMGRFLGHRITGDIHMGDWGLQMGLIITELKERGKEDSFTLSELEEIYPFASGKSKEDTEYKERAMEETKKLQERDPENYGIWKRIMEMSVADLKQNYSKLNVDFDLWMGESDADPYIAPMVEDLKAKGFAKISQGALVIDVSEETDKKEVPPCMLLKSDGAALYTTTDLATLVQREKDYHPDRIVYIVDKRQGLHFTQVFRAAKKTGIVPEKTVLDFLGFGTMNGRDGKPFKTRDGGVMRLETLIGDVREDMLKKMEENDSLSLSPEEMKETSETVALAAIKYGDLSNQASKDYIFDIDKFTSFEGNTGPYILYTLVRIKSVLRKYEEKYGELKEFKLESAKSNAEKTLMLILASFTPSIQNAFKELAPHRLCAYLYELSDIFNRFYHETRIISEEDKEKREGWISLLMLSLKVFSFCLEMLGMNEVDRM